ncbi:MAG TPA: class I SAM-dependent methyltransferase [Thermoanaerobaculia bacterium]|nr:class I SAM-dependent methyltransferase [Thermoanaerobaculia bacterium]
MLDSLRAAATRSRRAPPDRDQPVEPTEEALGRALLRFDAGLGLFRLVHLLDAVTRGPAPRVILSVGSGLGLQEAFLALRHPGAEVVGIDLRTPRLAGPLPNLRFLRGDLFDRSLWDGLPAADFVFSVECLEHLEDDETVVGLMASKLAPGGRLYLQVPFASEAELADRELCRRERDEHGHVRPGYSPERLRGLAARHGLAVELIAAAYRFPLQPFVRAGTEAIDDAFLAPRWRSVLTLLETDVRDGLAANRTEATAIRLLARREGPEGQGLQPTR